MCTASPIQQALNLRRERVAQRPVAGDDRDDAGGLPRDLVARQATPRAFAVEHRHRFHKEAMALARLEHADRADGAVGVGRAQARRARRPVRPPSAGESAHNRRRWE